MPRVRCPSCHRGRSVERRRLGTPVGCHRCGHRFVAQLPARDYFAAFRKGNWGARAVLGLSILAAIAAAYPVLGVRNYGLAALDRTPDRTALGLSASLAIGAAAIVVYRRRQERIKELKSVRAMQRDDRRLLRRERKRRNQPPTPPGEGSR
jgi:hypothetical protein